MTYHNLLIPQNDTAVFFFLICISSQIIYFDFQRLVLFPLMRSKDAGYGNLRVLLNVYAV